MFETQIAKGVEYLDQDLGPSWVERIDLDLLDLWDGFYCVIGQLYGDFSDCDFEDGGPCEYGFDLPTKENGLMQYQNYDVLTLEWRKKISQLRAERAKK